MAKLKPAEAVGVAPTAVDTKDGVLYHTYTTPSGNQVSLKVPTLGSLYEFEAIYLANDDKPISTVLDVLTMLGVDNLNQLPPSDFSYLSEVVGSFFTLSQPRQDSSASVVA